MFLMISSFNSTKVLVSFQPDGIQITDISTIITDPGPHILQAMNKSLNLYKLKKREIWIICDDLRP